jgi:hypothetical protein
MRTTTFQLRVRAYLRAHPYLLDTTDRRIAKELRAAGLLSRNTGLADCHIRDAVNHVKQEQSALSEVFPDWP